MKPYGLWSPPKEPPPQNKAPPKQSPHLVQGLWRIGSDEQLATRLHVLDKAVEQPLAKQSPGLG